MERYKVIKTDVQREWLAGCPVRIDKYNILIDNQTGNNVLQIKYTVLFDKSIKSAWADIFCFDDANDPLITLTNIAYNNINVRAKMSFGDKQPVAVNANGVGNIKIAIKKVVFTDDTVWRNDESIIGTALPEQLSAKEAYGELYNQYYIESVKLKLPYDKALVNTDEYWRCTCGQANAADAETCCFCGASLEALAKISDKEYLSLQNTKRLEYEKAEAERIARVRAENKKREAEKAEQERLKRIAIENRERDAREKAASKRKKIFIAVISIVVIIVVGCFVTQYTSKMLKYKAAEELLENKDYDGAIEAFAQLEDFSDSSNKLAEATDLKTEKINSEKYAEAATYVEQGGIENLKKAAHIYRDLNYYSDSKQKLTETYYNLAVMEYNGGNYADAASHYKLCGSYNNSQAMATSANNQVALANAIAYFNKGNYENALKTANPIPGTNNAKQGGASANQIIERSKKKMYEQATGGKLSHQQGVAKLEYINYYGGYRDSIQRINNLKNRCTAISGYYPLKFTDDGFSSVGASYRITADYKTNEVTIKKSLTFLLSTDDYEDTYTCQLSSYGGTYGSAINYDYSHSLYFYNGYLTDTQFDIGGFRFEKE